MHMIPWDTPNSGQLQIGLPMAAFDGSYLLRKNNSGWLLCCSQAWGMLYDPRLGIEFWRQAAVGWNHDDCVDPHKWCLLQVLRNQHQKTLVRDAWRRQEALVREGDSQVENTRHIQPWSDAWNAGSKIFTLVHKTKYNRTCVQCASTNAWPAALMDPSPWSLVTSESLRMKLCWPTVASNIWNMWGPWRKLWGVARRVHPVMKFLPWLLWKWCSKDVFLQLYNIHSW